MTSVQRKACDFYEKNNCENKYCVTFNADNGLYEGDRGFCQD